MSIYEDSIVPWLIDVCCTSALFTDARRAVTADLEGTVLEIGFGSGSNLPFLPAAVTRLLAVDPALRGRKLARKRLAKSACPVDFIGLDAQQIQLDDASADSALSTFSLCTIPDPVSALREVKRILKPGGRLYLLEHGRSPDVGVWRWQERLNGVQRTLFGGCHINRDITALVRAAGFTLETCHADYMPHLPRPHGYVTRAVTAPAS